MTLGILPALLFVFLLFCKAVPCSTTAAAAAKSLQSCPTLCDPIDGSPSGSAHPWDSPGKNTGVGCHCLLHTEPLIKWWPVVSYEISASNRVTLTVGRSNKERVFSWTIMLMDCLPNRGWISDHTGALPTGNWHLPSTCRRIKSGSPAAADFQHCPERSLGWSGMKHSVHWGKLTEQAVRELDTLSRFCKIYF